MAWENSLLLEDVSLVFELHPRTLISPLKTAAWKTIFLLKWSQFCGETLIFQGEYIRKFCFKLIRVFTFVSWRFQVAGRCHLFSTDSAISLLQVVERVWCCYPSSHKSWKWKHGSLQIVVSFHFGVVFHFYDYGRKGIAEKKIPKSTASRVTFQGIVHHILPIVTPLRRRKISPTKIPAPQREGTWPTLSTKHLIERVNRSCGKSNWNQRVPMIAKVAKQLEGPWNSSCGELLFKKNGSLVKQQEFCFRFFFDLPIRKAWTFVGKVVISAVS